MLGCSVGVSDMLLAVADSDTSGLVNRSAASLHDLTRILGVTLGVVE